jgi:ribonuclease-3
MMDISKLEKEIGIEFKDKNLLINSIVHSSYANEHENFKHNERLEFLGDAVLDLIMAEYFYKKNLGDEGELTKKSDSLVNKEKLPQLAREIHLEDHLLIGNGVKMEGKVGDKILGDALEALIGAIFLDKKYGTAKQFVTTKFSRYMELALRENLYNDPKGKFQEEAQKKGYEIPEYRDIDEWSPDNDKHFKRALFLGGEKVAEGTGTTKKEADKKAAENGLIKKG